jgi:hypothetical protein
VSLVRRSGPYSENKDLVSVLVGSVSEAMCGTQRFDKLRVVEKGEAIVVRIQKSRAALLLDRPFFGTLPFRLGARLRTSIEAMATQLMGTLAHEVMHPALQHHTRRNGRNPAALEHGLRLRNQSILVDAGLTLPEGVLLEDRFRGMSAERIYNLLEQEEEQSHQSSNDQDSQDGDSSANG